MTRRLRCAVYTRKSTEEGLDQEFNSLDAQREACVAFIASQASLGWKIVPDHYDDGGISGGTLERPAIQRLLQDIRDKKVDVVVVYKIDRLTRSLMDFSKIVEIFDASSVSFVSVTQQFNTTTSMGRLTLNVLLSFAQFEREVTAERIRDKIAASKKKGMWMGGTVSLGYQVRDRKLIIKEPEASFVRSLFDRYLQLRSVPALSGELAREAIAPPLTPGQPQTDDVPAYTRPIRSATLYKMLSNPIYVGKLRHRQNIYDGEHEPIIDADRFGEIQALLAAQASAPRGSTARRDVHLLSGLLFDDTGDRMGPTHANKQGKRYRYYVSRRIIDGKAAGADGWRIPARELESAVQNFVMHLLSNRSQLAVWIGEYASSSQTQSGLAGADGMRRRCDEEQPAAARRGLFKRFFRSITLTTTAIRFDIHVSAIVCMLINADGGTQSSASDADEVGSATMTLEMPISLKRRGNEQRLIIDSSFAPMRTPDAALIDLVAKAHLLFGRLTGGSDTSITDVAKNLGIDRVEVGRILPLAFLAPKIVEAVLQGTQPQNLSQRGLARMHLPLLWADQAAVIQ